MEPLVAIAPVHRNLGPGIVSTSEYLGAGNGGSYNRFWARSWRVVPEKQFVGCRIPGNSGFFVVAGLLEEPDMLIPGCRFAGFARRPTEGELNPEVAYAALPSRP